MEMRQDDFRTKPEVDKLFDSVIPIERGKHSEKPEEFRKIIQTLYPGGSKLELFARTEVEGWTVYGNELTSKGYDDTKAA